MSVEYFDLPDDCIGYIELIVFGNDLYLVGHLMRAHLLRLVQIDALSLRTPTESPYSIRVVDISALFLALNGLIGLGQSEDCRC